MTVERKKILIAVDGSEPALEAVRYVAGILPLERVHVTLFHVTTMMPESFWDSGSGVQVGQQFASIGDWREQQEKTIRGFMQDARSVLLSAGAPADAVVETVQERLVGVARDIIAEAGRGYDAVVVGRKGVTDLKDLVFGSVAAKVIERAVHSPVWVVGGKPKTDKVLVAFDASEGAFRAVDYVGELLGGSDVEIELLHTIRSFRVFRFGPGASEVEAAWSAKIEKEMERIKGEMENGIEEARRRLVEKGLKPERVTGRIVSDVATRAGCVVDEARHGGFGTIVVGRRGISEVEEFFMGRVSNKVVQMARELVVWVVS
ncbi:MAG: universal stress protein [Syntrophobacteraceae bacterium]|jgi:nucleotide-binding universal stress UspA family protein